MSPRLTPLTFALAMLLAAPLFAQEGVSPGQADLDKATELKINATDLSELNKVIRLLDSALDKGLDEENEEFAEDMLVASLMQRAGAMAGVLLSQPGADPQRNPQLLRIRKMVLTDLQRIVMLDDKQVEAFLLLGRLESMRPLGDPAAARDALSKVIKAEGVEPKKLAQAYALRSVTRTEIEDSVDDLNHAIELDPEQAEYRLLRARALHGLDQHEKAEEDIAKAIELAPDNPAVYQLKALILIAQDKLDEALESFNKATELAPADIGSYQMRSQLLERMGDSDKALEQIDKAIELQPANFTTRMLRANLLIKGERYGDALDEINRVIQMGEAASNTRLVLQAKLIRVQLHDELGLAAEALAGLEELAEKLPDEPQIQLQLAAHYMDNQRPNRAIAALDKVLELAGDNQIALRLRGDMYLSIGNHASALDDFRKAYEQNQEDSGLLNNYAWTLATSPFDELRDGDKAIELATAACVLTEFQAPHILSTLAAAYAEAGDFDKAVEWSSKAVELAEQGIEAEQLDALREELEHYKAGKPMRELQQEVDAATPEDEPPVEETPMQEDNAPARSIDF